MVSTTAFVSDPDYTCHFKMSSRFLIHNLTDEEIDLVCGSPYVEDERLNKMRFFSSGVVVCLVGAFGLIGNFLTCVTLRMMSRTMTLFNKLLLTLALIDAIFILAGGAFMTKQAFE